MLARQPLPFFEENKEPQEQNILSVSQASNLLKKHVETQFCDVHIRAEISGYKKHASGHAYFALKDADAVMDGVIWRGTKINIDLEDGMDVIVQGRITTYPQRSKYQMIVQKVDISGQGDLMKLLLERKEKLQKEGLFEKKTPLPKFPKIIGIITSETGAVIKDILHRLQERYPCKVLLFPTLVQGSGAAEQISNAITLFNRLKQNQPDVLIIARGGGSFEDLWAFNEENVVRAIYASTIPVISAIGHETDFTLADYAADLRAPTPTAAAELATPVIADIMQKIGQISKRLMNNYMRIIENKNFACKLLSQKLKSPQVYVNEKIQRLDDWTERLERSTKQLLLNFQQKLALHKNRLTPPNNKILYENERLRNISLRMSKAYKNEVESKIKDFQALKERLYQASYQKVLDKGFSLITDESSKPITFNSIEENQNVCLFMKDGKISTTLNNVKKQKNA